jgi:uncharacterized protein YdeI (YjbR/CyaY-like superfamily)
MCMARRADSPSAGEVLFFEQPQAWRRWLARHHATTLELWVGFRKTSSGMPSVTWPQAVDQALCFGWIDGVRKSIDETSYKIRFTPRKTGSHWSAVNIKRMNELVGLGLVEPAGRAAFEGRDPEKAGAYSYEQRHTAELPPAALEQLRANRAAWEDFQRRPPSYRRQVVFWIISAKQEETRQRRLEQLIVDSAVGRLIGPMRYGRHK